MQLKTARKRSGSFKRPYTNLEQPTANQAMIRWDCPSRSHASCESFKWYLIYTKLQIPDYQWTRRANLLAFVLSWLLHPEHKKDTTRLQPDSFALPSLVCSLDHCSISVTPPKPTRKSTLTSSFTVSHRIAELVFRKQYEEQLHPKSTRNTRPKVYRTPHLVILPTKNQCHILRTSKSQNHKFHPTR